MPQSQPHPFPPLRGASRAAGAERVFADDDGRTWNVVTFRLPVARATGEDRSPGPAVVFTCTSDARLPQRASVAPADVRLTDVPEATLRTWLAHAPHLGRLS